MSKINFFSIKEPNIAIHFSTQKQLDELCNILYKLGYKFGTAGNNVQEIKELGIKYFSGTDNQYLSLERNSYGDKYVSCGIGYKDTKYNFNDLNFHLQSAAVQ